MHIANNTEIYRKYGTAKVYIAKVYIAKISHIIQKLYLLFIIKQCTRK